MPIWPTTQNGLNLRQFQLGQFHATASIGRENETKDRDPLTPKTKQIYSLTYIFFIFYDTSKSDESSYCLKRNILM